MLSKITDITHALFVTHGPAFLPAFDKLLPAVQGLLGPGRPVQDLQWSICMIDDILEFAPTESVRYAPVFLEPMARGLTAESPAVGFVFFICVAWMLERFTLNLGLVCSVRVVVT